MQPKIICGSYLWHFSSVFYLWYSLIFSFTGLARRGQRLQGWLTPNWGKNSIRWCTWKERKGGREVYSRRRNLPCQTGHHWRRLRRLRGPLDEGVGSGGSPQGAWSTHSQISEGVQRGIGLSAKPSIRALTDRTHFPSTTLNLSRYPNGVAILVFANKYCNAKKTTWRDIGSVEFHLIWSRLCNRGKVPVALVLWDYSGFALARLSSDRQMRGYT